ncbi:uncharacterized protein LOC119992847 [Tripterygium wilfordii]|uniref:uncharacterized protein LOC119992847 n=1 Tax=Tripterygium wilfordii TaxID=458696 RepID=UPI0018F7ED8D|nr:uncharacterized protein LOC119992847 [Tripterygium wilfordii]
MELFQKAKVVRLRSHHDKYLLADSDEENVCQDRNGTVMNARWIVEFPEDGTVLRFKSCYGKYLTASNMPQLLGVTGKKVIQTLPRRLDSSLEWEPIREGFQVRLKTRYGQYLRANGGLPPWRNSITHDIPHRTATQDWVLWEVDVVEIRMQPAIPPPNPVPAIQPIKQINTMPPVPSVPSEQPSDPSKPSEPSSPTSIHLTSAKLSRLESDDSSVVSPVKCEGRVICYKLAANNGDVDDKAEELSFTFKGNGVEDLKQKLEEETGLENILVCTRNPFNGKLYPLRLHLPPNNATMHVVVLPSSGKG